MPIIGPLTSPPFDTVETAMNMARAHIGDAIPTLAGSVLTDVQPFSQQMANTAWRNLQLFLVQLGFSPLEDVQVIAGIPASTVADPGVTAWMNWSQYSDGISVYTPPATPVLPQNFMSPREIRERPSGASAIFQKMDEYKNGLPLTAKIARNYAWQWAGNTLRFPGSTVAMDFWLFYAAFFPDFQTIGGVNWTLQPIPIMRAATALSYFIAVEVSEGRGDVDTGSFLAKAQAAAAALMNTEVLDPKAILKPSEYGKMRDQYSPVNGPGTAGAQGGPNGGSV